jgi:mRNA interferase MazF
MIRGDLISPTSAGGDPNQYRTFVVVSRQVLSDSRFSTVVCAPVFSSGDALSTPVASGPTAGLNHECWIMCDNFASLSKSALTAYVGVLSPAKVGELNRALKMVLDPTECVLWAPRAVRLHFSSSPFRVHSSGTPTRILEGDLNVRSRRVRRRFQETAS